MSECGSQTLGIRVDVVLLGRTSKRADFEASREDCAVKLRASHAENKFNTNLLACCLADPHFLPAVRLKKVPKA